MITGVVWFRREARNGVEYWTAFEEWDNTLRSRTLLKVLVEVVPTIEKFTELCKSLGLVKDLVRVETPLRRDEYPT